MKSLNEKLLNEQQAAEILNWSVKTLQAWRWKKTGPRYVKLGSSVRYRPSDIDEYIEGSIQETRDSKTGRAEL